MEPDRKPPSAVTWNDFEQREARRRSLFLNVWEHLVPKVFMDVPRYYRPGNIVASFGLWELWVWQFVQTIELRPQYRVLDVCAGTNDVGVRLLQKEPAISVTAIDRSAEMQEEGQRRAKGMGLKIDSVINDVHQLQFADASALAASASTASAAWTLVTRPLNATATGIRIWMAICLPDAMRYMSGSFRWC
jgi:demethylmenaquinone methyltransferase/2-methoxy-6-polyprenyl-1,4-benzoquinol methylase